MADRIRLNLVGDTFSHTTGGNQGYSTHGKRSRHVEWVTDGSGQATVYVDHAIESAEPSRAPQFAWLLESRPIASRALERFLVGQLEDRFDLVFTHDDRLLSRGAPYVFVPGSCTWINEPKMSDKSKLVSMISSSKKMCEGHLRRLEWVERLRDKVDLYGRGFNEIETKEEGLSDYCFSVAIENDATPSYFSEKILDCFATGTVPIYLGTPTIGRFFNRDGIISLDESFNIDDLSYTLYEQMLDAVSDNFLRVLAYDVGEDYIYRNYLREL